MGSTLLQDAGFQGFTIDGVTMMQPKKKPRNGALTAAEKATNRSISSIRVAVEHTIARVKRFRIIKDTYRLYRHGCLDFLMCICCGLHNFIAQSRSWKEISLKS